MKSNHSEISPSNFERRMLCAGSLMAERGIPDVTSKYAAEGTMLHERTTMLIESSNKPLFVDWKKHLSNEQVDAVKDAVDYFQALKNEVAENIVLGEFHEKKYDLSFIYSGMKGTADSVLILQNVKTQIVQIHVVDYKFGKGVKVDAIWNYQLILYFLGVINDTMIKNTIGPDAISVHLHIVQPFIKNSRWDLTEIELLAIRKKRTYLDVVENAFLPNAKRTADKKACMFCKAKPTCPALAAIVPKLDVNVFDMGDQEIAKIYDNKELIKLYLASCEDYIMNKLQTDGFEGYALRDKMSNRKWNDDAPHKLEAILGEDAWEHTTKLIGITKAEKLLKKYRIGNDDINELTTKEVTGVEIIKI